MSTGSGVGLIVLGAILYWAVDVNLPYVDAHTLGTVLMTIGVVTLAVSLAVHMSRSSTSVGTGIGLVLVGAICTWGLNVQLSFVNLDGLGVVLMIGGVVAIAATLAMEVQRSRTRRVVEYRSPQQDRQAQQYPDETRRLPAQPRRFWG
jgi:hypothetical protein